MHGRVRLGAVLNVGRIEHRFLDFSDSKVEFDMIKVMANISNFKEKIEKWSAAQLAREAEPTAKLINSFPAFLERAKDEELTEEKRSIAILSHCVMHAKAILMQQRIQQTSPVAASPALFAGHMFARDQFLTSSTSSSGAATSSAHAALAANPSHWAAPAPQADMPDNIQQALGPALLKQVETFRNTLVKGSVKKSTEQVYISCINSAFELAGIPWSALPVRNAQDYSVLIAAIYGKASRSAAHTVKDEAGVSRVKWSFVSSLKAALKFFHETRVISFDFTSIASSSEVLRMFTAIKKQSHREVQKEKEKLSFSQFVELNDYMRNKCGSIWEQDGEKVVFKGLEKVLEEGLYPTCNLWRQLTALVRDMLMLRIGILAERRKSELVALLEDSVEAQGDGSLVIQVLRGKTEFSRGDLAKGRKAVVPATKLLQPSPRELNRTLSLLKGRLLDKWKWSLPLPKVGPDPRKEFHAPHALVDAAAADDAMFQEQRYVLPSLDNKKEQLALWNTGSLNLRLKDLTETSELSFQLTNPGRLSFRATGATFFSRTDRRAAIQNAGWTSSLMSFQVYAQLEPEQLVRATQKCLMVESKATVVMRGLRAVVTAEKRPRSVCLALYRLDPAARICEFLAAVVETWHLLDHTHQKMAVSVKWDDVISAANDGSPKLLVSTDEAREAAKKIRTDLKSSM
jgi:hypothetical protein